MDTMYQKAKCAIVAEHILRLLSNTDLASFRADWRLKAPDKPHILRQNNPGIMYTSD